MTLSVKNIFLTENEKDIFIRLKEQGIDTEVFAHKFQYLFQKIYNNEVGYYNFRQEDILYKFIVLPKTISVEDNDKERAFVNYLLHYYRINNIYGYDKTKKIPNSLLSLAFESNNKIDKIHEPLELFEFHKTKAILKSIETFFKKHKNYQRVEQAYVSQSIKHKLNLGKNIKEINKSKIHQNIRVDILYSDIATVSYYALRLYMQKRLKHTDINNDELKRYTMKISSLVTRKYMIDKCFSLSLPKLYGHKVTKLFQKKDEYKMLLTNLRSLFGHEQLHNDTQSLAELRHDLYTSSFFIKPDLFYEWYVYDILKKYADDNGKNIQFDKREGTVTKYKLNDKDKSSNPDYILTDESKKVKIVIDAKWKNVNEFGDIKPSDYLKLRFDSSLIQKQGYGVVSYLVYPQTDIEDKNFTMIVGDEILYKFHALEIDMDFVNRENSLSFAYDFGVISDEMEREQVQKHSNQNAVEKTQTVQTARDEVIQNLINAESSDEKEELGGLFDEMLWQQSEQLAKQLDVEIVLDEVQELLNQFDNVMEEESITFIKSTSTIYAHYKDEKGVVFDYSMPGSGLWKLIEVELNTSFVRYIRYKEGVISSNSSWDAIIHGDKEINIKWVKLNERDKNNRLKGLMFGQLKFLSKNDYAISLFNGIVEYDFDKQWTILDKVVKYRNEHAHIKAMSKDIFEELWGLLFQKDDTGMNELQKLLMFKQNMKVYIDER